MATGAAAAASAAKKKDDKKDDKYEPKEKIKDWSELKKLIKDWQQQFREQSSDFRFLVDEARKRELKLSECRQQLASFKRRVLAAEHTQKVVDEKIKKIQVQRANCSECPYVIAENRYFQQDHMEILEKLGALQSKIKGTEFGVSGHKYSPQQLQDDVGICLLKLGRSVLAAKPYFYCAFSILLGLMPICSCSLVVHECAERWESRFFSPLCSFFVRCKQRTRCLSL
jgi:hypothetical protein